MPDFTPTPEQLAIVDAATSTSDNLLISALAGAAKTSTLILLAEALPDTEILALAFNVKVKKEMEERLPPNCKSMTLNGLGHSTWRNATGRTPTINKDKGYEILDALMKDLSAADRRAIHDGLGMGELLRIVAFGKQCGFIPTGHFEQSRRLLGTDEFFPHIDWRLSDLEHDLIIEATLTSIRQALVGQFDFDDQILMPTVFHGAFPRYPLVLVDEAQDLSALNHATLRKLVGTRRLIAVGDERQAIYGFRGAHEDSMHKLGADFSMREMSLSTSFRCPEAIVDHARWRAPHMQAANPGGTVHTLTSWSSDTIPDSAFILCRNNAPLFRTALRLLRSGRHVELSNGDVAKQLLRVLQKFGDKSTPQDQVLDAIARWVGKERAKVKQRAWSLIDDKAACLQLFAEQGPDLGSIILYVQHLINSSGTVKLKTIHGAKGLEADDVFILDENLIGDEGQEHNLRYVAQTRSKCNLTYIYTEDYE